MDLEWLKLRTHNGSVNNAFEELVCQLAKEEKNPLKEKFIRVAAPDGGVESYVTNSGGMEYGWQAKFFTSMNNTQWSQIEKSFKTAFEKHPKLVKYYICLPLDRPDPRIVIAKGKSKGRQPKSFMDNWNDKVAEWQKWAYLRGRNIDFEYWGSSELFDRLTKPENAGKRFYWFNREEFSDEWFNNRLREAIVSLDKRYTPELNFELPIAQIFDGIYRSNHFKEQFLALVRLMLKCVNDVNKSMKLESINEGITNVVHSISEFMHQFNEIDFEHVSLIDLSSLNDRLSTSLEHISSTLQLLYELDSKDKEKKKNNTGYAGSGYSLDIKYLQDLDKTCDNILNFINSDTVSLANNPILIVSGEAGIGKSHLLADVASRNSALGMHSILILGQQLINDEPWSQIKRILQVNCDKDTFLAALNSKADSLGTRIVFFIDAINEGEGKIVWKNHLLSFIETIRRYPNIGVVFSIRSSYERLLIPERLKEHGAVTRVRHVGFANHEYEASKLFFNNSGIKQPSIPLLHPEFSNPLMLKLFCEGLIKKGLHVIPDGYEGISTIFNFNLEAINDAIFHGNEIMQSINPVAKIAKILAAKIAETDGKFLPIDEAFLTIQNYSKELGISDGNHFFNELISEGLITKNLYWNANDKSFEGIYIAYERFADHLISSYLIEKYSKDIAPQDLFRKNAKLSELVESDFSAYKNQGLIEAFSIQLPEKLGLELYEVLDKECYSYNAVVWGFLESLIWRKRSTINSKLKKYVNSIIGVRYDGHQQFINTILLVTSDPSHYFNSDFLHNHLVSQNMADRDSWWTTLIHNQYPGYENEPSAVKRIVDWAWTEDSRKNISDESIRLMAQTMMWFLSSTNRALRDSTTKALVCILRDRPQVLIKLIEKFKEVNDPYILQRVYAISYGCAVNIEDINILKLLGNCVYECVFDKEYVYPDILLRDYARNVIEFASYKGVLFDFSLDKVRPPYKSVIPNVYPSDEEVEKYEYDRNEQSFKEECWGANSIINSMKTNVGGGFYGDFGRYVFEYAFDNWKDVHADELSNLAVEMIFKKYGYDIEKHGEFDNNLKRYNYNRHYFKEERIGKKYQWIALHELLAKVADNYQMYENGYSDSADIEVYNGPWEPFVRDIDPTITTRYLQDKNTNAWWNNCEYKDWYAGNQDWIFTSENLPNPINLIDLIDSKNNKWLCLESNYTWHEPLALGREKWEYPTKELWYQIRSYIVKKEDKDRIVNWVKRKCFMGRGRCMPETPTYYKIFSREYYWAPACERTRDDDGNLFSEIYDRKTGVIVDSVFLTANEYLWERQSGDSSLSQRFYKPSEIIYNLLELNYSKKEGQLINDKGEVVCFDPSVLLQTDPCLLVKKDEFIKKLEDEGLDIFWEVLGEKQILGRLENPYIGRLNISGVITSNHGILQHFPFYHEERPK